MSDTTRSIFGTSELPETEVIAELRKEIDRLNFAAEKHRIQSAVLSLAFDNIKREMDELVAACLARDFNRQQILISEWESRKRKKHGESIL